MVRRYVDALLGEIHLRKEWLCQSSVHHIPDGFHSVYIGGGTPSIVPTPLVGEILGAIKQSFPLTKEAEITLEVNPGTVCPDDFLALRQMGVNRLSIGIQSFDDHALQALGRLHSSLDVHHVVRAARVGGFENLSFDLMLGLPDQSLEDWQDSLSKAVALRPQHISCYELTIEPKTLYGDWYREGKFALPSEDVVIDMLQETSRYLVGRGYEHYEISNYSLPGFRALHNLIYWQNRWYLGLGVAAYSYWEGRRWGNVTAPGLYQDMVSGGRLPEAEAEMLDLRGQAGETVMLGLRLSEGVSLAEFENRFGVSVWDFWEEEIESLLDQGLLELKCDHMRLTHRGLLLANQVQSAFL